MIAPQASTTRLRALLTNLRGAFLTSLGTTAHGQAYLLARELEARLKEEWVAGGHDRSADPDRPSHLHAIDDTRVYTTAFGAACSLGPAWRLIQFGWRAHIIAASQAPYLHFKTADGHWVKKKEVRNPGYSGDDVVGRALLKTDLSAFSLRVVSDAYARLLSRV